MLMYNPSRQDAGCGEVPLTEGTIPEGEETCETGGLNDSKATTGRSRGRRREEKGTKRQVKTPLAVVFEFRSYSTYGMLLPRSVPCPAQIFVLCIGPAGDPEVEDDGLWIHGK